MAFMNKIIDEHWRKRLVALKTKLAKNNFDVYLSDSVEEASALILKDIVPRLKPRTVSWGDSQTFLATGVLENLRESGGVEIIDIGGHGMSFDESLEQRRKALLSDLFFTGTNAVTEDGRLVNLDMIGNRTGGITFGPRHVVICVGRNKLTGTLEEAMSRVRNYAAPVNARRFDCKTPCVATSFCTDCASEDRICNSWTITEKSFPKGRIKVVLINQDLGF